MDVVVPYRPRELQKEIHTRIQRFALLVCHRRFGKTVAMINELIKGACECELEAPRFAYIAPLYKQAKTVAWDFLKHFSREIPGVKPNESELRIDFPWGARVSLYGADNPDALRGIYLDGVVLDEYAQISARLWGEIIRPALSDRKGWAVFIGTPKGHNAFYDLYEQTKLDPDWFVRVHRASETGYVDEDELKAASADMSDEEYEQEFECSWSAAIRGSYYGRLLEEAEKSGRISRVNADPSIQVETWWDLGIGDSTAIWFAQRSGAEIRLIDYYETSGEALSHYAKVLEDKAKANEWIYSDHVLPHDANHRSLDTGHTRLATLDGLGVKGIVLPQSKVEDGIEAARRMLPNCWFDELRCQRGLDALRQYRAEYDDKRRTFRLKPLHDWTSHGADAFRYGAMRKGPRPKWETLEYDNRGIV